MVTTPLRGLGCFLTPITVYGYGVLASILEKATTQSLVLALMSASTTRSIPPLIPTNVTTQSLAIPAPTQASSTRDLGILVMAMT
jgi:hypothetical protein